MEYGDRHANTACTFSRAKNIVAVRRKATGIYCITAASPISPATDLLMAGVEYQQTAPPQGNASAPPAATYTTGGCDPATEFKLVTQRSTATTTGSPASNISFWFAISGAQVAPPSGSAPLDDAG